MKTIYKEEYCHRKLPTVIGIFFFLAILIPIHDMLTTIVEGSKLAGGVTSGSVLIVLAVVIMKATIRFKYKYRCSLISDQLIIHKLSKHDQHVEHNIKVKDIISIKKVSTFKFILKRIKYNCYLSTVFNGRIYCCTYKVGDKEKTFFFQPSSILIKKVKSTMNDEYKSKVS
jgi:hypothetical protein